MLLVDTKYMVYQAVILGALLYAWPVKQREVHTLELFTIIFKKITGYLSGIADLPAY